jgi:hypothetical protein
MGFTTRLSGGKGGRNHLEADQMQIRRFFAPAHIVIAPEGVVRMARAMSNRGSRRLPVP